MLFLPDSYIEKYGKKTFALKPVEQIRKVEFELKYTKVGNTEIAHIKRIISLTTDGSIKITDNDIEKFETVEKSFVKDIINKIYSFIDRGGLVIDTKTQVGFYTMDVNFIYSDNTMLKLPSELKFTGLFEEYLGDFLINEIMPLFDKVGIILLK